MDETLRQAFLEIHLDDYVSLLNLSDRIRKSKTQTNASDRIAVIGTASIQMIVMVLDTMLSCEGYFFQFYEGEYDGLRSDIYDQDSAFYRFDPCIVIMLPDITDIKSYPPLLSKNESVVRQVEDTADSFIGMFEKIHKMLPNTQIICSNFVGPFDHPLGNMEGNVLYSKANFVKLVNIEMCKKRPSYVTIADFCRMADEIGWVHWYDPGAYAISKQAFHPEHIGRVCDLLKTLILSQRGQTKKCLVLDLDNTLWGGAVGDLGADQIILDPNDPEGESYISFQRYLKELKERGIILAICSKNDVAVAKEPFKSNPYMILKEDDISCFVANWDDKVSNIHDIAESLNIGLDSMVFFDDNATERALVSKYLPMVKVIEVPDDPAYYIRALDSEHVFDWLQLTDEDTRRTLSYVNNINHERLKLSTGDYNEYLKQLNMKARFEEVTDITTHRFVQLLNKTNQFNTMTNRYTDSQVGFMRKECDNGLYTVSLSDCYSEYGIIACVILRYKEKECNILDWCMSCRVLKKGVENYTLKKIIEKAIDRGANRISGSYRKTQKNNMVKDLFLKLGFKESGISKTGSVEYTLSSENFAFADTNSYITEVSP